ncbi:G5 domain-containing protein [Candidatus Saccharibacteria bacterium]|nr:G5 domain-containing protein [Candidatus Saccharibacteria bacterium]
MRIPFKKKHLIIYLAGAILTTGLFGVLARTIPNTFANDSEEDHIASEVHHVIIHDQTKKLTIKTDAITVREALERAEYKLANTDVVEPKLTTRIDADNFHINVYRSRPVLIIDGTMKKYVMTSSYDGRTIAEAAGLTIYDGDEIKLIKNENFLEAGDATTYQIIRNGGRTITVETPIAYEEETVNDTNLADGASEVRQVGEEGIKSTVYKVNFVNGEEVSRELVEEKVTKEPVKKITAVGSKAATPSVPPEWETCATWARQAGVSEADLYNALTLIYHESGCRVNAANPSGAYGIPQALPGSKMAEFGDDWQTNPITQIKWMAKYVTGRYGGWQQAMAFWWGHHWY